MRAPRLLLSSQYLVPGCDMPFSKSMIITFSVRLRTGRKGWMIDCVTIALLLYEYAVVPLAYQYMKLTNGCFVFLMMSPMPLIFISNYNTCVQQACYGMIILKRDGLFFKFKFGG